MRLVLLIFMILASVGFYNPCGMLSDQAQKLVFYVVASLCLYVAAFGCESGSHAAYPVKVYVLLLVSIVFSGVMATAFHAQSLGVSMVALLPYVLGYSMFFVLARFMVPPGDIMRAYIVLCAVSAVVYFVNVATFPANLFGKPILAEDVTRGVIRIPVVFIEFFPVVVFYSINRYLVSRKKIWMAVAAAAFVMIVLSVIRQIIALTAILGLLFVFRNISWRLKAAMIVAVVCAVAFVLPQIPMYRTMLELSEAQAQESDREENIRVSAWRYYTYENQTNVASAVFGNGLPSFGNSRWGVQFDSEVEENGYFAADVGWAGFYWYFGAFAALALMWLMLKGIFIRKTPDMRFATYSLAFLFLTSFASGPPVYYWQIIDIVMCLYFAYCGDSGKVEKQPETFREAGAFHFRRFPQLPNRKD